MDEHNRGSIILLLVFVWDPSLLSLCFYLNSVFSTPHAKAVNSDCQILWILIEKVLHLTAEGFYVIVLPLLDSAY